MSDNTLENWKTNKTMDYHRQQYVEPKRSTVKFEEFLARYCDLSETKILSLACGGGAAESYIARRHPNLTIHGIDIIDTAFPMLEEFVPESIRKNITLSQGDWYNLDSHLVGKFDGVISLQTLSWLEDWEVPLGKICDLNPKWMALSSLFYDGKINYQIKVTDYERPEATDKFYSYYNIYSLPIIRDYLKKRGYTVFKYEPFEIDIDIPKPDSKDLGTYTVKTEDGHRLQISAAMLMPWYFILASK